MRSSLFKNKIKRFKFTVNDSRANHILGFQLAEMDYTIVFIHFHWKIRIISTTIYSKPRILKMNFSSRREKSAKNFIPYSVDGLFCFICVTQMSRFVWNQKRLNTKPVLKMTKLQIISRSVRTRSAIWWKGKINRLAVACPAPLLMFSIYSVVFKSRS